MYAGFKLDVSENIFGNNEAKFAKYYDEEIGKIQKSNIRDSLDMLYHIAGISGIQDVTR